MNRPTVILYNQISLNGALTGFEANPELYYQLSAQLPADAVLVGSVTAKTGLETYADGIPPETEADFLPPQGRSDQPYWVFPDTTGRLEGLLHAYRQFPSCREVVVLVSETTPAGYRHYLEERQYPHAVVGSDKADLVRALEWLAERFAVETIRTDTGPQLGSLLFDRGVVDQVVFLVTPLLSGRDDGGFLIPAYHTHLLLKESRVLGEGFLWLWYEVRKPEDR